MSYYSNAELAGYRALHANYEDGLAAWQADHDTWAKDPSSYPAEPEAPEAPAPPATTYDFREIAGPEEVETDAGTALILPPSVVVTSSDGAHVGAMLPDDFARAFTDEALVDFERGAAIRTRRAPRRKR